MQLNKYGWPKNKIRIQEPKILYAKNVYFMPNFFWRKIYLCIDLLNFRVLRKWYMDKFVENFTLKLFLKFYFLTIPQSLFYIFIKLHFTFSKKIKIKFRDTDVVLFGPYLSNHAHKIIDYLLRLVFIKKQKISRVFLPDQLKLLVKATRTDYLLKDKKIHYFKSNKNYIFENVNYLSHIDTRFYNPIFKKCTEKYKKFLTKNNYIKNNKFKYILISRNCTNRKLINENELFKLIRPLGFLKINFEDLSLKKQIEISQNAEIIVGYHGAGLSNCFFMKKNKIVIEIMNKNYNHPIYKICAQILELNYKKFLCLKNYRNFDGICDAEKITKYINTLM